MSRLSSKQLANFHAKVVRGADEDCWEWTGARAGGRNTAAYGTLRLSQPRRMEYAHRVAYAIAKDIDLDDLKLLVIRHRCDNPLCCNPLHIESGTQADNTRDMSMRDRSTRGERSTGHVLKEADVHEVRRLLQSGRRHADIASAFGVCRATISLIASGRNWGWLADNDNEPLKSTATQ